jgi:hypothetical protein
MFDLHLKVISCVEAEAYGEKGEGLILLDMPCFVRCPFYRHPKKHMHYCDYRDRDARTVEGLFDTCKLNKGE